MENKPIYTSVKQGFNNNLVVHEHLPELVGYLHPETTKLPNMEVTCVPLDNSLVVGVSNSLNPHDKLDTSSMRISNLEKEVRNIKEVLDSLLLALSS